MPDNNNSPVKVFRHPLGLPGKKIKLSDHQHNFPSVDRDYPPNDTAHQHKRDKSPLGITIDTNISRPQGDSPKQIRPTPQNSSSPRHRFGSPLLDHLKGLKSASTPSGKELSPFDREVPIVLSNQNTPKFPISKNSATTPPSNQDQGTPRKANRLPPTPTIVLESPKTTSKQQTSPWKPTPFARVASSIYTPALSSSKPTPAGKAKGFPRLNLANIPPVPKLGTPFSSIKTPMSVKTPGSSATTEFEEDSLDSASSSRRASPDGVLKHRSMETVPPTPRRSKGWWNLILSPFESKNTPSPKDVAYTTDPDAPGVPVLERAAPMGTMNSPTIGAQDASVDPRASLMTLPHRRTFPTYGEAAKYYDPNQTFGEDEDISPDALARDRDLSSDAEDANNDKKHESPQVHEKSTSNAIVAKSPEKESSGFKSEPSRHDTVPSLAANSNQSVEVAKPREHAHAIAVKPPISHEELHRQATANQSKDWHHFSGFSSGNSPSTKTHSPHEISRSPETPGTAFSPGVVEVADARHFHTARSVETRSARTSPMPPPKAETPKTKNNSNVASVAAPQPERPARVLHHDHWEEKRGESFEVEPHWKHGRIDNRFRFEQKVKPASKWSKGRIMLAAAAAALVFIILLTVILVLTVTQHHSDMPVAASWLNLTEFPAIPTGIATIARPNVKSQSSCVSNTDLWTCSLPKEQQADNVPNDPSQPNMRIQIRFNGDKKLLSNSSSSPLRRRQILSRSILYNTHDGKLLSKRDGFNDMITTASPPPPNEDEQDFLGNTTDKVNQPFAGEDTPFIISFLPTTNPASQSHSKRDDRQGDGSTPFEAFPRPLQESNNTAAAAMLLPYPSAQPLKLFDRGKDTEHYGFYTYFSKSVFMNLTQSSENSTNPINSDGGISQEDANALCTWSETRFLVQIWTKTPSDSMVTASTSKSNSSGTATATDFTSPGTFPLPVTVTLDRHGGDPGKKAVYCYGLDEYQRPISDQKGVVGEARDYGGILVNPAGGPFNSTVHVSKDGYGGVDGGTGGCSCQWTNW